MNDIYFIDYEAKTMLADTVGMRPDTELAHRRLCDIIWLQGQAPPNNTEVLMEICRVRSQDWMRVRGELLLKGWLVEDGLFTHNGCIKTMERCRQRYAKTIAAAKAGAAGRWGATAIRPQSDRNSKACAKTVRPQCQSHSQSHSHLQTHSDKESDKASAALPWAKKTLADRLEAALNGQWTNDAGKWISRIKSNWAKTLRVMNELENAMKEGRIKTTPAQYAEQIWKEFA